MIGCEIECPDCGTLVEWNTCDGVSCCWRCGWEEDGQAADVAILRRLGRKYRSGRATPDEAAAFEAADERQKARQRAASNQVKGWWDLPVARACWEGDARQGGRHDHGR